MRNSSTQAKWLNNIFVLKLLPIITLIAYFDLNKRMTTQEINAAIINISGRQRMLCQRAALLALRLVSTPDSLKREALSQEMLATIDLMSVSHNGLLNGNPEMKLPGHPSTAIQVMYFGAPLYLDRQVRDYIDQVRALAQSIKSCDSRSPFPELSQENPHLQAIIKASETELLQALDAVVNQYQKESEEAVFNIDMQQAALYQQSCAAAAAAHIYAHQREQILQDLQCIQDQLVHTEKLSSIGQMIAGVAHEINNPVSFIYGNLRYANDYVQDLIDLINLYQENYNEPIPAVEAKIKDIDLDFLLQDLPKVLGSMEIGANRVRQIVLSLRNFTRCDQVLMKLVDLHEGIDHTLLILQNRLKARCDRPAIEVVKEYGELPTFECYAGQLNQVFMNLLSNAIDAMESIPNHIGRILIRTRLNADGSGIIIQIVDNGSGITEEVKAQLFEPFFTTKPQGKGTGLGLSISHQIIVEKHKGILKCESELGKGTEFWIEIPLQLSHKLSSSETKVMAVTQ